jgi:hypothetical protein
VNSDETLINVDCSKFLTLEEETILIAVKKHPFTLIANFAVIGFVLLFLAAILIVGIYFITSISILLIGTISIALLGIGLIIHTLIDSYYHTFIVTNRKLLEIRFLPFSESVVNEILLDQVKCTELDMKCDGFIHNILNIGSIMITFDRPTHQEVFVIPHISEYRKIGMMISQLITTQRQTEKNNQNLERDEIWFRVPNEQNKFRFIEETQHSSK